jgi:hypothetical protein
LYAVLSDDVVYFAHKLTWHEADEILRIAINSLSLLNDSKSLFSIKLKEKLIFFKGSKTQMTFVVEYNDKLWQSLRCRMVKRNLVELTKSELQELYYKKIQ